MKLPAERVPPKEPGTTMVPATAIAIFLSTLATVTVARAADGQVKCTVLEQVTATHGPVATYVAPAAVKIKFTDINAYLIARAPTWKIMLVNVDSGLAYECSYDFWLSHLIRRSYFGGEPGEQLSASCLTKGKPNHYAENMCDAYYMTVKLRGGRIAKTADYFVLPSSTADPHAFKILEKWFAVPFMDAIPVAMKWYDPKTGETYRSVQIKKLRQMQSLYADNIDTKRISSQNLSDSFFSYPKGLQAVTNENDIFSTKKTRAQAESIFSDLEHLDGSSQSTKPKPKQK